MINPETACAATVGFFDGLHVGHQYLLSQLRQLAAERGLRSLAVTFENHPRSIIDPGFCPQLLTSPRQKLQLLSHYADSTEALRFDAPMARMTAAEFMTRVLRDELNVRLLLLGYDHRFGSDRMSEAEAYRQTGRQIGMEVVRADEWGNGQTHVSSSAVRSLLSDGLVSEASAMLGRPYRLEGTIVSGHQLGRQLGYPTANLQPECPQQLIPQRGVYAVAVSHAGMSYQGMLNIGTRPTLHSADHHPTIEVHLFGFSGNLYGCRLAIDFISRIRSEQHFDNLDRLRSQLKSDQEAALQALNTLTPKQPES